MPPDLPPRSAPPPLPKKTVPLPPPTRSLRTAPSAMRPPPLPAGIPPLGTDSPTGPVLPTAEIPRLFGLLHWLVATGGGAIFGLIVWSLSDLVVWLIGPKPGGVIRMFAIADQVGPLVSTGLGALLGLTLGAHQFEIERLKARDSLQKPRGARRPTVSFAIVGIGLGTIIVACCFLIYGMPIALYGLGCLATFAFLQISLNRRRTSARTAGGSGSTGRGG